MKFLNFAGTVMGNFFSKPATTSYPFVPFEYKERTRGHIEANLDECIFCGLCAKRCPCGAITVNKEDKTWSIERFDCIQCGLCVEVCNKNCLSMDKQYTKPGTKKTTDVVKQAQSSDQ